MQPSYIKGTDYILSYMYPGPGRLILHESKSLVIRDYVKIRYAACGHMKIGRRSN